MSSFTTDPGDLSPDEMYDTGKYRGTLVKRMPCPGCKHQDGSLNTEWMDEEGTCTFGCGHRVDADLKYCGHCHDHSANSVECEYCGCRYEKWDHAWAEV
jgi:hypothetical protein